MAKEISKYLCEICGFEYAFIEEAQGCEDKGIFKALPKGTIFEVQGNNEHNYYLLGRYLGIEKNTHRNRYLALTFSKRNFLFIPTFLNFNPIRITISNGGKIGGNEFRETNILSGEEAQQILARKDVKTNFEGLESLL
jgi:hypothetical protein